MTKIKPRTGEKRRAGISFTKIVLVVCSIIILFVFISNIIRMVGDSLLEISSLSAGELDKMYQSEGVLIWDETVVTAPASGELAALVKQGERVRAGDGIAEVKTSTDAAATAVTTSLIRSAKAGVVIFHVDGLEGLLNPGNNDILEFVDRQEKIFNNDPGFGKDKIICEKGRPVLKIIDNLSPLTLYLVKPEGFPRDLSEKESSIFLEWNDNRFTGRITDIKEYSDRTALIVQSYNYPPGLFHEKRKISLILPGGTVSGYLVNEKSLAEKNGVKGIYIRDAQKIRWIPVRVEGVAGGRAAVSSHQIGPCTTYVANPRWLLMKD